LRQVAELTGDAFPTLDDMLPCAVRASQVILDASSEKETIMDAVLYYVNFCDAVSKKSESNSIDDLFNLNEKINQKD
jgi:hypothetical protein